MSRFLEISDEAEYWMKGFPPVALHGFVRGAEWADETMLDKACEWLGQNGVDSSLIESFRKAMEE